MSIKIISGGVCAPKGFLSSEVHSKAESNAAEKDISLIYSKKLANAAAIYTENRIQGASVTVTKANLENGRAQAIIRSCGNGNCCTESGIKIAEGISAILARELKISKKNVIVASDGVIGKPMSIEPFERGIPELVAALSPDFPACTADGAATSDTGPNGIAVSFTVGGVECKMGGIAMSPASSSLHVFITTDCAISSEMLAKALATDVKSTYDTLSIDGAPSPNDMISVMANSAAGNREITKAGKDFKEFTKALNTVNAKLCRKIAAEYAGASKLIECSVACAVNEASAKAIARSVIGSLPVRGAMHASRADWGCILSAIGNAGVAFCADRVAISFISAKGEIPVCSKGVGVDFSEEFAKEILSEDEITIAVKLGDGDASYVTLGCDLAYGHI